MKYKSVAILAMAVSGVSYAGDEVVSEAKKADVPVVQEERSWCDLFDLLGKPIYSSPDNPFLQEIKFYGRAQLQYAYIDGEGVDGADFSEDYEEIRRLRFGAQAKLFNYFTLKGNMNLVRDGKQVGLDRDIEYVNMDEALAIFDAGKAFDIQGLDSLTFRYGRQKVLMGQEVHTSSKKIKTVERSAVANRIYPTRMTGALVKASKGNWSGAAGVFSTDYSREIAGWSAGEAYYLNSVFELSNEDRLIFDFLYNDANGTSGDNLVANNVGNLLYEWAFSGAWEATRGRWGLMANATIGDNGETFLGNSDREGMFYGFVVLPTYWIVPGKLEAVGRYSFQYAEEDEGIRSNSRYFRREVTHDGDVNSGRGDRHHSIYGGLNWYLCGDNAKVMSGVEWERLDTAEGDADATTLWLAFRTYF